MHMEEGGAAAEDMHAWTTGTEEGGGREWSLRLGRRERLGRRALTA